MKSINIDQALKKGIDAHKAGKVQEAEQYYRSILNSTPDHAVTNHNMGILAVNIGKSDAALNFFKKAIDLNPDIIQFWLSLIETLLRLKRVEEAGIFITKAKRQIPENVALEKLEKTLKDQNADSGTLPLNSYIASATGLRELGEFDKAINVLKSASENYPNEVLIYTLLSHCYMLTNDFEKAEFYHLKTKSFNIDIAEIHWNECRLLLKKKSTSEALVVAQRANETFPNNYEGLGILASCLNESNKIEESLTCVNKALELEPNFTEALVIRGIISLKQKNNKAALKDLENAHKSKPHLRQIWQIIISLKLQAEQFKETILLLLNMIEINPEYDEGVSLLIELTQKVDIPDLTIKSFEKIAKIKNRDYLAFFNLGTAYQKINDNENAIKNFRKTIQIKPDYVEAHNSLGICLYNKGFLEDAIECYKKAIQIKPRYVDALNNLGNTLVKTGDPEQAIKYYTTAINKKPENVELKNNLGNAYRAMSNTAEARKCYEKAISLQPENAEAYLNLSILGKFKPNDKYFLLMQKLSQTNQLSNNNSCYLSFALGKAYDDFGEYEKAFSNFKKGNDIKKKITGYSINTDKILFKKLKDAQFAISKTLLVKHKKHKLQKVPIFIVGMPRSGTSLVEQIISCHPKIKGLGELEYIQNFGFDIAIGNEKPTKPIITHFRSKYLKAIKNRTSKNYFTDKMPQNFRFIPLICCAFPEAKIILVERNPEAVCWSNFTHHFQAKGLDYCYSLEDIKSYYKLYTNLIGHWRQRYSDKIYTLNYDKLTNDQESETKNLIRFLDVDWDESCLSPENNTQTVNTASQFQVNKKVYKGSSRNWLNYEKYLNGAFQDII